MAKRLTKADQARDVSSLRKVIRLPSNKGLKDLLAQVKGYRRKSGDNSERIGKLFAAAVKHAHVHKPAALLALRFDEMEEGKRAVMLAHFDHYREQLGLDKIRQGALDLEGDKDKTKAAAPAAVTNGNGQVNLEQAIAGWEEPKKDPPRAETLVDPDALPTRAEVKAAADRAEKRSKLPLN